MAVWIPPIKDGQRRYGNWAGNPKGIAEDTSRCIAEVQDSVSDLFRQCGRKRGHGTDGQFCKQHSKQESPS